MGPHWHIAGALAGILLWVSSGCSSATSLSEDFGESTATAAQVQRLHPRPVEPTGEGPVLDGHPAERIIQRYIQSFDRSASATSPGMLTPPPGSAGSMGVGQ